jgi:hypothetical protein
MTDENIIAIVAIVVSGVVSVATLFSSYYTNRANNRAKLREMVHEKRLDALRDVYTATCKYYDELFNYR